MSLAESIRQQSNLHRVRIRATKETEKLSSNKSEKLLRILANKKWKSSSSSWAEWDICMYIGGYRSIFQVDLLDEVKFPIDSWHVVFHQSWFIESIDCNVCTICDAIHGMSVFYSEYTNPISSILFDAASMAKVVCVCVCLVSMCFQALRLLKCGGARVRYNHSPN